MDEEWDVNGLEMTEKVQGISTASRLLLDAVLKESIDRDLTLMVQVEAVPLVASLAPLCLGLAMIDEQVTRLMEEHQDHIGEAVGEANAYLWEFVDSLLSDFLTIVGEKDPGKVFDIIVAMREAGLDVNVKDSRVEGDNDDTTT